MQSPGSASVDGSGSGQVHASKRARSLVEVTRMDIAEIIESPVKRFLLATDHSNGVAVARQRWSRRQNLWWFEFEGASPPLISWECSPCQHELVLSRCKHQAYRLTLFRCLQNMYHIYHSGRERVSIQALLRAQEMFVLVMGTRAIHMNLLTMHALSLGCLYLQHAALDHPERVAQRALGLKMFVTFSGIKYVDWSDVRWLLKCILRFFDYNIYPLKHDLWEAVLEEVQPGLPPLTLMQPFENLWTHLLLSFAVIPSPLHIKRCRKYDYDYSIAMAVFAFNSLRLCDKARFIIDEKRQELQHILQAPLNRIK